ncbi:NIPSNAP family protein [Bacillus sp. FSL W7-1360]
MFYRRKYYVVKNEFVSSFNHFFLTTNLPTQQKYGAKLVGRWMKRMCDENTEIFAIWEYESDKVYEEIERKVRSDKAHVARVQAWYDLHGGRERLFKRYIIEMKNERLETTLEPKMNANE